VYIYAMLFVRASHGYQCPNNKFQTRWLSDNTDLTPRHMIVLSKRCPRIWILSF